MTTGDPSRLPIEPDRVDHDIFISYSRRDQEFVRQLYAALKQANRTVWVDWVNIPAIAEWRPEILTNIEAGHNFVFVLSPHSLKSEVCNEELTHAIQNGKRLVPIVCQTVDPATVHPELAKLNWIFFRPEDDFDAACDRLLAALDTDLEHVRVHTRLLVRSREWDGQNRDSSFLLRGRDLAEAEQWLACWAGSSPPPTRLQQQYIEASHQAEVDRQQTELALRRLTPQQYRNRQALLSKVRNFWVKTVLETSLHGQAMLELGLEERPDRVAHPWDVTWETAQHDRQTLPLGTRVSDLFEKMGAGRTLLILGEPGSGKTTTLLELAQDLLERAEENLDQLMPVVFNLSSWQGGRQTLNRWLVEELNSKYQVPRKTAEEWVANQQLLLLLDGLDEVRADRREACVRALNELSQQTGMEMVVCSRSEDYAVLSQQLQFQAAIVLQSLTLAQVDRYLEAMGSDLAAVQTVLREDAALQELVRSPLMLSILTLAYRGMAVTDLPRTGLEESRRHLFQTYIQRMLNRRGGKATYSPERTCFWLSWLARRMQQQSQTVFLIERMQPDWLPPGWQRNLYQLGIGLLLGPLVALLVGPTLEWTAQLLGLDISLGFTVMGGWVAGLLWGVGFILLQGGLFRAWGKLLLGLGGGILWASFYLITGSLGGTGLWNGLVYGVLLGLVSLFIPDRIQPVETLKWSWRNARAQGLAGMRLGLLVGGIAGVMLGAVDSQRIDIGFRVFEDLNRPPSDAGPPLLSQLWVAAILMVINGVVFALLLELVGGLVGALLGGVGGTEVSTTTTPNQGIWQSARHALVQATIGALCLGATSALLGTPILAGVLLGLLFGLLGAGLTWIQHGILRLLLWSSGLIPWNYARLLDYATRCILLQKVGGGYIFIHRLLLEYFADLPETRSDRPRRCDV